MLSPSYLYSDTFLVVDSVDKFGLLTTGRLDIKNILKNLAFAAEPEPMEIVESEHVINKKIIQTQLLMNRKKFSLKMWNTTL